MSELDAAAVPGLESLDVGEWDRLVLPRHGPLRHGHLRAWERAEVPGLVSRPLVARAPGLDRPLAAAAAYLYDLDLSVAHQPILPEAVAFIRRLWPRFLVARLLELGAPTAHVDPLMVAGGVDPEAAAEAIVAAARAEAERARAQMIVVQDLVPSESPLGRALRSHGFAQVPSLPTVVLDLEGFTGYDDYLDAMRAKYRRRARQVMRHSDHLQVELVEDFSPCGAEFARLWRHVYDRATETRREILTPQTFAALGSLPYMRALVLRRPDGSIASFGLLMDDGPWLQFLHSGFTAEAGRDEAAYFRLTFEIVRHALERGYEAVNLGCTTLGPKLDLGGRPVELCAWIRHRNPVIHRVYAEAGRRLAPPTERRRRVFSSDR